MQEEDEEEYVLEEHQVNEPATQKYRKDAKYTRFMEWLRSNGAIIDPRVQYPTAFGPSGYVGVSCSDPIPAYEVNCLHNQAVIAIPKTIIIDADGVKKIPEFAPIIKENPRLFSGHEQTDAAFNTLSLFLIYEQLKGNKSFYFPYFQASQSRNLLLQWTRAELEQLENRQLMEHVLAYKDEQEFQFMNFLRVIRKYDKVFPPEVNNEKYKKMFEWAYEFVMTRAFGWSVPSASLIPFADMLNHGERYLDHFLIDLAREKAIVEPSKYVCKAKKCNMAIFRKQGLTLPAEEVKQLVATNASYRSKYLAKHQKLLEAASTNKTNKRSEKQQIACITHQQYNSGVHKFRQLTFAQSSCSEDNDTDDQDISDLAYRSEKMKIDSKNILRGKLAFPLSKSLAKYWQLYEQPKLKGKLNKKKNTTHYQRITGINNKQQGKEKAEEEEQSDEESQEEVPQQELSQNSRKSQCSSDDEQDEDDEFEWMSQSKPQDVYFVLYTHKAYAKNEQLYNFYGRRSNRFLLLGYNFATLQNKYDSYSFRLVVQPLSCTKPIASKLIFSNHINAKDSGGLIITRQLKLKKQRVCIELINHCRCIVTAYLYKDRLSESLPAVIPLDRQIQQGALALAKELVKYQLDQYQSDLQTDEQILQNKATPSRLYTAVVIRYSHKRILKQQLKLIDKCVECLGRWKSQRITLQEKEMLETSRICEYLYELQRSRL